MLWDVITSEFSDLPDWEHAARVGVRLLTAAALGGLLGFEREWVGKAAGLRTHMLTALGAAFFVLAPLEAGMDYSALSRVIQGLTAGIGFIGGGAILKRAEKHEILGITTATSIWLTAAIGVAAGMGRLSTAFLATLLALIIITFLQRLERRIHKDRGHTAP